MVRTLDPTCANSSTVNTASRAPWLAETGTLRIPKVYHFSLLPGGSACIIMEHLTFGGRSSQEDLGRGLARMHLAPVKADSGPPLQDWCLSCVCDDHDIT